MSLPDGTADVEGDAVSQGRYALPPLVWLAVAWLVGIAAFGAWSGPLWVWWLPLPAFVLGMVWRAASLRRTVWGSLVALNPLGDGVMLALGAGVALVLGGLRAWGAQPPSGGNVLWAHNDLGEPVTVEGVVVNDPEARAGRQRLQVMADRLVRPDGEEAPVRGTLITQVPLYPALQYGDRVRLTGLLETPPTFDTFDYRTYLARRGIFSQMRRARVEYLSGGHGFPLYRALYALRRRAARTNALLLPEPHAALLNGILLGIEGGIPDEVMERFNTTGTTHILVISGFNISILAGLFLALGRRMLGRRGAATFALVAVFLYTLLVGADAAVTRAAIMGGLYVFARQWGLASLALNSLGAAAVGITLLRPATLYDMGFQLSALATLALILFVPGMTAWVEARFPLQGTIRRRALDLVNEALVVTLAAQLLTTPLIVYAFGRLSIVALLTNALILPVQAWVMLGGGLATLAGLVWLPLGRLVAWVPWAGLTWTLMGVEWTARLPYAQVRVPSPGLGGLLVFYAAVGGVWWLARHPEHRAGLRAWARSGRRRLQVVGWAVAIVAAVIPWALVAYRPDGRLHLVLLDVGQGDAILLRTPDGKQVVVDGGPDPQVLLTRLGRHLPPWDRTLDLVVLTHPDADHLGGLPELLDRYQVGVILDPTLPPTTALGQAWERVRNGEGARLVRATQGQVFDLGHGVRLEVLWPPAGGEDDSEENNNSVVLRVRYGRFCALLTGDIEAEVEHQLVAEGRVAPCAVLKVAHHGSATSTTSAFVRALRPAVALISVGARNRFGHPDENVLERLRAAGARIYRTDAQGNVELISDGTRLWVHTSR
ncbi:MAG: DNA internalization-related competence protein ComEC/Rec2 [Ardenticatenia bacterium]|nr:DNA internalization-related competence protein ComEC/Rec2 [Ardenticatenia bacterium]